LLIAMRCYFDGANKADRSLFKTITLASVSGTPDQWKHFEKDWANVLASYDVDFLHTTDAVVGAKPFTRSNGWIDDRTDKFISECVQVISSHIARPKPNARPGLFPITVTVVLDDFVAARDRNGELPLTVEEFITMHVLQGCFDWGLRNHASIFDLYFDQNEPFHGHILDRKRNPRARREQPIYAMIGNCGESNMRQVPALQMADLLAWSIDHKDTTHYPWQKDLLALKTMTIFVDYGKLSRPVHGMLDLVKKYKLSQRRPTR
jgi:hypothetical protein